MADQVLQFVISAQNNAKQVFFEVEGQLSKLQSSMKKMGASWDDAVDASKEVALGFAAAGAAVGAFGLSAIKAAANQEQTIIAFETMLGSAEKANSFYKDLVKFAASTPFELKGLEQSSKQLLAYGFSQEEILPNLKALGDISAGVGMDKLPYLILAYGQVRAATKLTGAELRQFTEAGVPLLGELADYYGKTAGEVQEMISNGEVGFPAVQAALENLTGEGGRFNDLMQKQSQSLGGMWSNLQDAWEQFLRGEGARFIDWAKEAVALMIDIVQNRLPEWIKKIEDLTNWFKENKTAIAAVAGVVTALLVPAFVNAAASIGKAILALTVGNPWGLAIGAIVALATLIYLNWDTIKAKTIEIWNSIKEFLSNIWQGVVDVWNNVATTTQNIWNGIKDFFAGIWTGIQEVFKFGVALAVGLVIEYFNLFGIDIVSTWQSIIAALQYAWTVIQAAFNSALNVIKGVWNTVWTAISGFLSPIWEGIKKTIGDAWDWISGKFDELSKPISEAWKTMWEGMGGVVTAVWEGVKNAFKTSINFIIDGINMVINALNSVAKKGGAALGMKEIGIPNIPKLAAGGIVTSPTLAMIGEAGPEAIVPLSQAYGAGVGQSLSLTVNINGGYYLSDRMPQQLSDQIKDVLISELKRTMKIG